MNWFEPTEEQETQWKEFVRTRPDPVRDITTGSNGDPATGGTLIMANHDDDEIEISKLRNGYWVVKNARGQGLDLAGRWTRAGSFFSTQKDAESALRDARRAERLSGARLARATGEINKRLQSIAQLAVAAQEEGLDAEAIGEYLLDIRSDLDAAGESVSELYG